LEHPKAVRQFRNDIEAMEACDTCVLVLPCGRSAHTEAGWFAGRGKKTKIDDSTIFVNTIQTNEGINRMIYGKTHSTATA
jgi:hypothetical protein